MCPSTAAPLMAHTLPSSTPESRAQTYAERRWSRFICARPEAVTGMFFGAPTVPLVRW